MGEFDAYADNYESALNEGLRVSGEAPDFFAQGRVAWLAGCLRRLGVTARNVLDFGCGTGTATPHLIDQLGASAVTGVDVSKRSLEVARSTFTALPTRFRTIAAHQPDGSIDVAYCNGVFHHIPPAERPEAVRFVARCLRPGGLFALWENNPWNPGTRYVMSRIPFDRGAITLTPPETRRLMASAGLTVLRTDYCFFFPGMLRWLRGLEPYLHRFPLGAQYMVLGVRPVSGPADAAVPTPLGPG